VDQTPPAGAAPAPPPVRIRDEAALRRDFLLQMAVNLLALTALHASRPMVTYRALDLGAGPVEIGLVQSAFSLLPVFTAVALGRWIDRLGEGRFVLAALGLMSVASFLLSVAGSLVAIAFAQVLFGFGQVINVVAGQTMIANRAPRDRREHHYSWYSTVVSVAQLAGPALAAVIVTSAVGASIAGVGPFSGNTEAAVFLFAGLSAGTAFLLALGLLRPGPPRAPTSSSEESVNLASAAWRVLRKPGMAAAMFVSLSVISAVDVLVAYLPAYGEATGLSVETVGLLLSVRAGSSLVSRFFMTQLIERIGRKRLLTLSAGMAAAGILALPFVPSTPVLFGLMVVIGLGLGLGQPMTIAWVANRSARRERGLALSVRVTGNRAALVSVPVVMGAIAGASGISAIWIALAVFLGGGAIVALRTPFDDPPREAEVATSAPAVSDSS
jgi:MFS family permease